MKGTFYRFWLPVLLVAGLIFILSSFPLLFPPGPRIWFFDELAHMIEYGILGYFLGRAFLKGSTPFFQRSFQVWAVSVAILYGFTDEIHQLFVPLREASSVDLVFDGIGAFLAQGLFRRGV